MKNFYAVRDHQWRNGQAAIAEVLPVIDFRAAGTWCRMPYPGHRDGCPNYNRTERCPPRAQNISLIMGFPCLAVVSRFSLGAHVERMRKRHPGWSERQLRNVLYWQGTARKFHRENVERVLNAQKGHIALMTPEANGVNVSLTLRKIGIVLQWPPRRYAYQVALVGRSVPG